MERARARFASRRNRETRARPHRRATFRETTRNDTGIRTFHPFGAAKCAAHARTTHAPFHGA
eukprot:1822175-Lingulodinium_polyedra.AAC.1